MGEFDRVADQIDQYLAQLALVGADMARHRPALRIGNPLKDELQALVGSAQAKHGLDILEQVMEVQATRRKDGAPGLDLGHFQHVIDQVEQMLAAALNDRQILALLGGQSHIVRHDL